MLKAGASAKQGEIGFSHMSGGSWVWVWERCNVHNIHGHIISTFVKRMQRSALAVLTWHVQRVAGGSSVRMVRDFGQRVFQRNDGQDGVDDLEASSGGHMMFDRTMRKWDTAIAVQLVARSAALDTLDRTLNLGRSES